jgi:hypothetical protein
MKETTMPEDGIFIHECEADGCTTQIEFDDEPFCFTHSPDKGSSMPGYSSRAHREKIMKWLGEE